MRLGASMLPPLVIGGIFSTGPEQIQNVFPFFTGDKLEWREDTSLPKFKKIGRKFLFVE
jgi:hypothetical protein